MSQRRNRHRRKSSEEVKQPLAAKGVIYTRMEFAPGNVIQVFDCTRMKSRMAQTGCASRWRKAQGATGVQAENFNHCRSCPIGAAHAGEPHVHHSALFGIMICPRCDKGTTRMIHGTRCVSCYNREREIDREVDARGNFPASLIINGPKNREFRVIINGRSERRRYRCRDLREPVLQALRTTRGEVAFAFQGSPGELRQGLLFG